MGPKPTWQEFVSNLIQKLRDIIRHEKILCVEEGEPRANEFVEGTGLR